MILHGAPRNQELGTSNQELASATRHLLFNQFFDLGDGLLLPDKDGVACFSSLDLHEALLQILLPSVSLRGIPMRSASLNLIPGVSSRSS